MGKSAISPNQLLALIILFEFAQRLWFPSVWPKDMGCGYPYLSLYPGGFCYFLFMIIYFASIPNSY